MIPYNEDFHRDRTGPTLAADYKEANRVVGDDAQWVVWPARVERDVCEKNWPYEKSLFEHRNGWRVALGLQPIPSPIVTLPRLVQRGAFFGLDTGQYFTVVMASDFNLMNRWQHGEDIADRLAQRRDCRYNFLRVWTKYDLEPGIGRFLDIDYSRVQEFLQYCAQYGMYVELTAYTDIMDPDHWPRLGEAVQGGPSCLLEYCNERHMPDNWQDHHPVPGVLCSHGSGGSEDGPVRPWWDYEVTHFNGASEWQRKTAKNPMEYYEGAEDPNNPNNNIVASWKPSWSNETTRFPDACDRLDLAFAVGRGGAILHAGTCFHSVHGKNSTLWEGRELECARAWAEGARSVDMRYQDGRYVHRSDIENAHTLRVYQRVLDDGTAETVRIPY